MAVRIFHAAFCAGVQLFCPIEQSVAGMTDKCLFSVRKRKKLRFGGHPYISPKMQGDVSMPGILTVRDDCEDIFRNALYKHEYYIWHGNCLL